MKARKGYTGGLNRDASRSKTNPETYYNLRNFRVVTEDGLSSGSLENEKGTVISFCIPDIPETTLGNGEIIPAQSGLKIIGWGTISDTIVVFTTNETSENPESYGQLWKLEFNEETGLVFDVDSSNCLVPDTHLVYNNKLGFSTEHRIGRVIGRYETSEIQRVYWTDGHNPVRVLNVANPDSNLINPENVDIIPGVTLSPAIIERLGVGNIPTSTVIQFTYQLLSKDGSTTLYAPASVLYPLTDADVYSGEFQDFEGSGDGDVGSRSVTYRIKNIDTDFDVIKHVAIIYTSLGVATVYEFAEQEIPGSGELEVTCSDLDESNQIPLTQFSELSSGFSVAKDIEVKDNRLIAANTGTMDFSIDFDARAYRFDTTRQALITDTNLGNITINGTTPDYNIDTEHDAINPYNKEQHNTGDSLGLDWNTSLQYKYKADGITYGGEGPNISYEFVEYNSDNNYRGEGSGVTQNNHVTVNRWISTDGPLTTGVKNGDGSNIEIPISDQLKNKAAPYSHAYFKGYSRGEVYRFGIVLYSKKGSPSFVKWIGDIRIPEPTEGFRIGDERGDIPFTSDIGIKFTVNIDSIRGDIGGYSIVRLQRTESDKTRLGSGTFQFFDKQFDNLDSSLLHNWEANNDGGFSTTNPFRVTSKVYFFGQENVGYHLGDKTGFNNATAADSRNKRYGHLISPLGQMVDMEFKAGDFIKTTGYYNGSYIKYYGAVGSDTDKSYGFSNKVSGYRALDHSTERFQIKAVASMNIGEVFPAGSDFTSSLIADDEILINASYSRDQTADRFVPLGVGSPKLGIILEESPTIPHNSGDPSSNMNWRGSGDYRQISFNGDISADVDHKEVLYCRYLDNQYGGDSYESRSVNRYMSAGHFQTVTDAIPSQLTFDVYGGDVYTNYFDDEYIQQFITRETAYKDPYNDPVTNKLSVAAVIPVESSINTDWRLGNHWASARNSATPESMSSYESNHFSIRTIFMQENTIEQKFFAEDFLSNTVEEHPHQLWASDNKIDGELIDSWRSFPANNTTEVNGIHGPINRIINFRDRLYFYQNSAFGVASIDERTLITDSSGQELVLGQGGVFPDYGYISTNTGAFHQYAVASSENSIYHWDARLKKIFRYSGQGAQPLSDVKGLSSYLADVNGAINNTDKTLRASNPVGVHITPDFRYYRMLFTFLNHNAPKQFPQEVGGVTVFHKGDIILIGTTYYEVVERIVLDLTTATLVPDVSSIQGFRELQGYNHGFTVSYNEMLEAFESFYDYKPSIYLNTGRRLLSANPFNPSEAHTHNVGDYGTYYGQAPYKSVIDTILSSPEGTTNIYNNYEWKAELYTSLGLDIHDETFNKYHVYSEYQDTGLLDLTSGVNMRRRMRTWRVAIGRDSRDNMSRIRNPWVHLYMEFDNNNNKRMVVHDLIYSYTNAPL